jgi:hypothetical protein
MKCYPSFAGKRRRAEKTAGFGELLSPFQGLILAFFYKQPGRTRPSSNAPFV